MYLDSYEFGLLNRKVSEMDKDFERRLKDLERCEKEQKLTNINKVSPDKKHLREYLAEEGKYRYICNDGSNKFKDNNNIYKIVEQIRKDYTEYLTANPEELFNHVADSHKDYRIYDYLEKDGLTIKTNELNKLALMLMILGVIPLPAEAKKVEKAKAAAEKANND